VTIDVHQWEVAEWHGEANAVSACDVRVHCSGGTYVRALARDVARAAQSAAHLGALRRVSSGPFAVENALSLADLRDGAARMRPPIDALPHLPHQIISQDELRAVVTGRDIPATIDAPVAALIGDESHALVAVAERENDRWQPRVVMRRAPAGE
jgi:tRNA pseudouridine55 synthase